MFRRHSTGRWSCSTCVRTTNGNVVTRQVPSRIDLINADAKLFVVCQAGGMQAWAAAGRPVITDDGATGVI
jgi:hypothetical protein